MRSAGNFHPEWGYLAPAPSFMRTLRIAVVAIAIGATAGAAVVVSLVSRSGANTADGSIAAHALVTSAQAANTPSAGVAPAANTSSTQAQLPVQTQPPAPVQSAAAVQPVVQPVAEAELPAPSAGNLARSADKSEANSIAATGAPAGVAALAEVWAVTGAARAPVQDAATLAPAGKRIIKRRRTAGYDPYRRWSDEPNRNWNNNGGLGPLLRGLFSARAGWSYQN